MNEQIEYCLNKATEAEINDHLSRCDTDFVPSLGSRVEINGYAHKIVSKATRFEAWVNGVLIGLVAAYCNNSECRTAHITSVSLLRGWQGKGIASQLMEQCIGHIKELCFEHIELEVTSGNAGAIKLYEKMGFMIKRVSDRAAIMHLNTVKDA